MDTRAALLILLTRCLALGLIAYSPLRTAIWELCAMRLCRRFAPSRFAGTESAG